MGIGHGLPHDRAVCRGDRHDEGSPQPEPQFITAYHQLAVSYQLQWLSQQSPDAQTLEQAVAAGQRALALNDSLHWSHMILGYIYLCQQQYEQALAEMERTVALAPNEAWSYAALAEVLSRVGRTEEARAAAAQALRLKPSYCGRPLSRRRHRLCGGRTLRGGTGPLAALSQSLP